MWPDSQPTQIKKKEKFVTSHKTRRKNNSGEFNRSPAKKFGSGFVYRFCVVCNKSCIGCAHLAMTVLFYISDPTTTTTTTQGKRPQSPTNEVNRH